MRTMFGIRLYAMLRNPCQPYMPFMTATHFTICLPSFPNCTALVSPAPLKTTAPLFRTSTAPSYPGRCRPKVAPRGWSSYAVDSEIVFSGRFHYEYPFLPTNSRLLHCRLHLRQSICDLLLSWTIIEFDGFGGHSLDGANKIGMYVGRCYKRMVFRERDGR